MSRVALPALLLAAFAAVFMLSWSARTSASAREKDLVATETVPLAPPPPVTPATTVKPKPKKPRWRSMAASRRRGHAVAIVRRAVPLRARPNGRAVVRAQPVTEFGDQRVMGIAKQRGPWLGVVAPELANGKVAWVHMKNRGLDFRRTAYALHADLSGRWLELRKRGRTIRRVTVAIGRPGAETPTGRFAVTDKLNGARYGPYYGCCILALNGHQPKLPPGWPGGDRLAIHGTDSPGTIGAAASAGCLRAGDADLQLLMRRVPLGTPVFIRN
jgi:lipoprotein-anchoring transpeptidase ErfK/SrfK